MIAVITGAAVAFFQSTRIERFVTRNYADLARAQLAAEAGQATAAALLKLATTNDHFIIVANTNRQLFVGNGTNQNAPGTFAYLPLFSFTNNPAGYATNNSVVTSSNPTTNVSGGVTFTNTLPDGVTVTSPAVTWVNLTNASGQTNARFAFWLEDLAGRLDLSVAGSTGANAMRPTGTNPAELALWALFNWPTNLDSGNATVQALTGARSALVTPATAMLVTRTVTANLLPHLAASLVHDTNEPELVPFGFGYANQGQPKLNLNQAVTNTGALDLIVAQITNNLPGFTNRAGGMDGQAYVYALAASIIDYADANSSATATNINGINIVGFDNYPMLTHVFDRFLYDKNARSITITTYLQFWNPSSVSTPALSGGTFTYNLNDTIRYPTNAAGDLFTNRPLSTNTLPVSTFSFANGASTNHSFEPNSGFITSITNTIDLTDAANFPNFLNPGPDSLFIDTINGSDYDNAATNSFSLTGLGATNQPPIPLHRWSSSPPLNSGTPKWIGSVLGLRMSSGVGNEASSRLSADPRLLNYIGVGKSDQVAFNNYSTVYWQGYPSQFTTALLSGHPGNWPDGYNTANTPIPTRGINNPLVDDPPPLGPFIIQDSLTLIADPAPCKISNFGSYINICELGNIFDPIQWAPAASLTNYANADIGAAWTANSIYGGGATLRIGRPEHSRFTNDGRRAAQLLDLFAVGTRTTNGGATVLNSVAGRINLNTATTNTLRALAAGVLHTNDPALVSAGSAQGTNFVVPTNAVSAFVRAVTNARTLRPFAAPNQLTLLTNNTVGASWPNNAVFGNGSASSLGGVMGASGPISWTDAAAEEWFGKIVSLCTVRSRNFLVYVVAQAMSTNTNQAPRPIAGQSRVYQVYAEPLRSSPNGLTTNVNVRIVRSWSL